MDHKQRETKINNFSVFNIGMLSNAVWAGPVSALRWVLLSANATDGKPATCSK